MRITKFRYVCGMNKPRLTKGTYKYLEALAEDAGTTLYRLSLKIGLPHQTIGKWKDADPKTMVIIDQVLEAIRREGIEKKWFEHSEKMLNRFDIGSEAHKVILQRLEKSTYNPK